ncbi:MAG: tetratricopeptide repeat protein [Microscillaceae bacterium]|jgi:tetratricopeptide (TPR) repeat protein|nr:tetratricopeptide repeat protein [Microscillaceae bacterium]
MKHLLILVLNLIFFSLVSAQNQAQIDILLSKLKTIKDTARTKVLNDLSFEYHTLEPVKAIEYSTQALELSQSLSYTSGTAHSLWHLGLAYQSNLDYIQAQKYFYLALALEEKLNDPLGVARCLNSIGDVYKSRKSYKEAIKKYKRAVEIFEELGERKGTIDVLSNIAEVYHSLAKYDNALNFATKSLDLARVMGTTEGVEQASLILSEAYAKVGKYQEAYDYHLLHIRLRDSTLNVQKRKEINRIEDRFAKEKRDYEERIRNEKAKEEAKQAQIRRDNIQYAMIGIIFIALFGGIFFIGRFDIPQAYVESVIFITLLLMFRFFQVLLMPFADNYSEGSPLVMLLANVGLALLFMPVHGLLERRLKKKVFEETPQTEKLKVRPYLQERWKKFIGIKNKAETKE